MKKAFDMPLFLSGILSGSATTRQRHIRQARTIQAAIWNRWGRDNPWTWQEKHLKWFFKEEIEKKEPTRYYYLLTAALIAKRMNKKWRFSLTSKSISGPSVMAD